MRMVRNVGQTAVQAELQACGWDIRTEQERAEMCGGLRARRRMREHVLLAAR